jgi:lysophospholipase L1-like esterase
VNRFLLVLIVVLTASLTVAAGPPPGRGGGKDGGTTPSWTYVALGDSIASGFSIGPRVTPYPNRYRDHIQNDTGNSVALDNQAKEGDTSDDLRALLQQDDVRVAVSGANIVTWNIGGNDMRLARRDYRDGVCGGVDNEDCLRETQASLLSNWDAIIHEITQLADPAAVIVRTMDVYNPYVSEDMNTDTTGDGTSDFQVFKPYFDVINAYMCDSALAAGVLCAGVYEAFNGPDGDQDPGHLIGRDGVHPNNTGQALIAQLLADLGYSPLH